MLERQPGGAVPLAGEGERSDLDDLALTAGRRASLLLGPGDVSLRSDGVAAIGRQHGQQGVFDCAHLGVHVITIHETADSRLTRR